MYRVLRTIESPTSLRQPPAEYRGMTILELRPKILEAVACGSHPEHAFQFLHATKSAKQLMLIMRRLSD